MTLTVSKVVRNEYMAHSNPLQEKNHREHEIKETIIRPNMTLFVPANSIPEGQFFDLWVEFGIPEPPASYTINISQAGC